MLHTPMTYKTRFFAAVLATVALAACTTGTIADWYLGEVDTAQQRVYRAAGTFEVIGGLACEYVQQPTAVAGTSAKLSQVGGAAYDALVEARAYAAFDDDLVTALASLSGAMTSLAASTVEATSGETTADLGTEYVVSRALEVAVDYLLLKTALAGLKTDLAAMVAEGRDPTDDEWDAVMDGAEEARDCLATAGEES